MKFKIKVTGWEREGFSVETVRICQAVGLGFGLSKVLSKVDRGVGGVVLEGILGIKEKDNKELLVAKN